MKQFLTSLRGLGLRYIFMKPTLPPQDGNDELVCGAHFLVSQLCLLSMVWLSVLLRPFYKASTPLFQIEPLWPYYGFAVTERKFYLHSTLILTLTQNTEYGKLVLRVFTRIETTSALYGFSFIYFLLRQVLYLPKY